jgi:formamidopyrimidine-DNA glycosylase
MPELPEVETVKRALCPVLKGATLREVRINRPNLRYSFPPDFAARLQGAKIIKVDRRAKYLLFSLDDQNLWVTHLGMTGRFLTRISAVQDKQAGFYHNFAHNPAHTHVELEGLGPSGPFALFYIDPRRFGFMHLMTPDALEQAPWYRSLGVEPLSPDLTPDYLLSRLQRRSPSLKSVLMDQAIIAGLGNIYVCEALYRARLNPLSAAKSLDYAQSQRLVVAIKHVLAEAVAAGGSSISDFVSTSGQGGYFQHRFKVYDRKGLACATCDCAAEIVRIMQSGRSTFFCPSCQKM